MMIKRWQLEFQLNEFSQKASATAPDDGIQFGAAREKSNQSSSAGHCGRVCPALLALLPHPEW